MTLTKDFVHTLRLSALWIAIVLGMLVRDVHTFLHPGMLDDIRAGHMNGVTLNDSLLLWGGVVASLPIFMAVLPFFAGRRLTGIAMSVVAVLCIATLIPFHPVRPDDLWFRLVQGGFALTVLAVLYVRRSEMAGRLHR